MCGYSATVKKGISASKEVRKIILPEGEMNLRLKILIWERGLRQLELSRAIGVSDGYLSKIIGNWVDPPDALKEKIAEALQSKADYLFPKD